MTLEYTPSKPDKDNCYAGAVDKQYIFDCITVMISKEPFYVCQDYIELARVEHLYSRITFVQGKAIDGVLDEECRSKMCDWIFHVIDSTTLQRETAIVAINTLDRFLCSSSKRATNARSDLKEYQLAGESSPEQALFLVSFSNIQPYLLHICCSCPLSAMTCLYIAVKIIEPIEMDASIVSQISNGVHSAEEIITLECDILAALQWKMNGPTSFQFINYLLELLPECTKSTTPILSAFSHLQAEHAVKEYAFVALRQSNIAIASILNSLDFITADEFPLQARITYFQAIAYAFDLDICSPAVHAARALLQNIVSGEPGYGQKSTCDKKNNGYAPAA